MDDNFERMRQAEEEGKRIKGNTAALVGADARWQPNMGPISEREPDDVRVGDWGTVLWVFRTMNRVGDKAVLAMPSHQARQPVLIRGIDTTKLTDGAEFFLRYPVVVEQTFQYEAVSGAAKSVLIYDVPSDEKLDELVKQQAAAVEAAKYRIWSDQSGSFTVKAKYVRYLNRTVTLEKQDGTTVEVPIARLSPTDRKWVEAEYAKGLRAAKASEASRSAENPFASPVPASSDAASQSAPRTPNEDSPAPTKPAMADAVTSTPATPTIGASTAQPATASRRWLSTSYDATFIHVEGDAWIEVDNKTGKKKWDMQQTGQGADYVDLLNPKRGQKLRIYADHMDHYDKDHWAWVANGRWLVGGSDKAADAP